MSARPVTKTIPTDEELMALPKDGFKRELIDGEIVMSPAGSEHGRQIMRFSFALGTYIYARDLGELFDGQTGFRMSTGDLLCPDISFVSAARLQNRSLDGFFEGAPDLAVEFLSPTESKKYIERKLSLYFANEAVLVWIIDPRKRTVFVHSPAASSRALSEGDLLSGEDVIPGFAIPVASLFPDLPRSHR